MFLRPDSQFAFPGSLWCVFGCMCECVDTSSYQAAINNTQTIELTIHLLQQTKRTKNRDALERNDSKDLHKHQARFSIDCVCADFIDNGLWSRLTRFGTHPSREKTKQAPTQYNMKEHAYSMCAADKLDNRALKKILHETPTLPQFSFIHTSHTSISVYKEFGREQC